MSYGDDYLARAIAKDRIRTIEGLSAEVERLKSALLTAQAERDKMKRVVEAFEHADWLDWQYLFENLLNDSGHGKFWKAVMMEVGAGIASLDGGE